MAGYGSQGGGFGMGGSPGYEEERRIGAVGEMGLRAAYSTARPRSHAWHGDPEPRWMRQVEQSFRGRGPRGYRRSDERIREDVCDRLTDDHDLDASDIEVGVVAGEVTLEGTADERRLKWLAEEIAAHCSGVSEVHNHLRVRRAQLERRESESESESAPRNGGRQIQSESPTRRT